MLVSSAVHGLAARRLHPTRMLEENAKLLTRVTSRLALDLGDRFRFDDTLHCRSGPGDCRGLDFCLIFVV